MAKRRTRSVVATRGRVASRPPGAAGPSRALCAGPLLWVSGRAVGRSGARAATGRRAWKTGRRGPCDAWAAALAGGGGRGGARIGRSRLSDLEKDQTIRGSTRATRRSAESGPQEQRPRRGDAAPQRSTYARFAGRTPDRRGDGVDGGYGGRRAGGGRRRSAPAPGEERRRRRPDGGTETGRIKAVQNEKRRPPERTVAVCSRHRIRPKGGPGVRAHLWCVGETRFSAYVL